MIIALIGSICFLIVVILYTLLILGLPYGEFVMGGKYTVIPIRLRLLYIILVVIQIVGIMCLLQGGHIIIFGIPENKVKGVCIFFSIYLMFNTIIKLISISEKEKNLMGSLFFITSFCFFITSIRL